MRFPNGAVLLRNRIKHAVIFSYRSPGKSTFTGNNCLTGSCDEGRKKYFLLYIMSLCFVQKAIYLRHIYANKKAVARGSFFLSQLPVRRSEIDSVGVN